MIANPEKIGERKMDVSDSKILAQKIFNKKQVENAEESPEEKSYRTAFEHETRKLDVEENKSYWVNPDDMPQSLSDSEK